MGGPAGPEPAQPVQHLQGHALVAAAGPQERVCAALHGECARHWGGDQGDLPWALGATGMEDGGEPQASDGAVSWVVTQVGSGAPAACPSLSQGLWGAGLARAPCQGLGTQQGSTPRPLGISCCLGSCPHRRRCGAPCTFSRLPSRQHPRGLHCPVPRLLPQHQPLSLLTAAGDPYPTAQCG